MAKIQKSFRLEESVVKSLDDLVNYYNNHMPEFSVKKATTTDVVAFLIKKESNKINEEGSE